MAGAPSRQIAMPTGTTDAMKKQLKDLQAASSACVRQMKKDARQGKVISKDVIDEKAKLDKAIDAQKKSLREIKFDKSRTAAQQRADEARAGRSGSAFGRAAEGVMMLRHVEREVKRLDSAFKNLKGGGPLVDKEEGMVELLHLGEHIPGIGLLFKGLRMGLQAVMAIQKQMKEETRGVAAVASALRGDRAYIDPDEVERRKARPTETALTYVDPQLDLNPAHAPKALGGGIDPREFREILAGRLRNEQAGIVRTILAGLPGIGHYVQQGGGVWGVDDEGKINAAVENALNSKIPALLARIKEKGALNDQASVNRDLRDLRRIDPRLAPEGTAEDMFRQSQTERQWTIRKSIDSMGLRPIDGRAE